MDRKSLQVVFASLILLLGACKKEGPEGPVAPPSGNGPRVLVVCEGSLGMGNGRLGLYLPEKDSVYEDVFKAVNGQDLGDVFQSAVRIGDRYFLCINNSDKIVCLRRDDWQLEGVIPVSKPRYILPVSPTKAYVSTLFSNKVHIINPQTMQLTGSLTMPAQNPEGMALLGGIAYIAAWDTATSSLYALNPANDAMLNPIPLGSRAPQEVLADKEGKLWVLSGNVAKGVPAALTRIDPATGAVLKAYPFAATADPVRPVFNAAKDTLYFIGVNQMGTSTYNGVFRMGIHDAALPAQPFIPASGLQYFWALGIAPGTGHIYVGDPLGFTQRGQVYIYRQDGTQLRHFSVSAGPGHFYFD